MIEEVMKEENDYSPRRGWTLEEIATLSELKAAGTKSAALRVPHSPGEIYRKMSFMGKDFYNESTWDKYAID